MSLTVFYSNPCPSAIKTGYSSSGLPGRSADSITGRSRSSRTEGLRDRLRTASGVAAHPYAGTLGGVVHVADGSALPVQQTAVTGNWFQVLGVAARAGRLLNPADDRIGAPSVVVLSTRMAERLFGEVNEAVGRRVRIDEQTFTVVGVTPAAFDYPRSADAWVAAVWFRDSFDVAWDVVVRVGGGNTIDQTRVELESALGALPAETGPLAGGHDRRIIQVRRLAETIVGDVRRAVLMLTAAVVLMLLVAGVNVANLLLVRGLARGRELSVRAAIGASRGRIVRQLATEVLVLAVVAAVIGTPAGFTSAHSLRCRSS